MTAPRHVEDVLRDAFEQVVDTPTMFRALSEATLLLAVRTDTGDSPEPYVFEYAGSPHGAVFTSPERTAMLPGAPGFLPMPGRELGRRWPDGLLVLLNPGSGPLARAFDSTAFRLLATPDQVPATQPGGTAMAPGRVAAGGSPSAPSTPEDGGVRPGAPFAIGAPAQAPPGPLVDALRAAVRTVDGAEGAYLFQFVQPPDAPHLVAGVLTRQADEAAQDRVTDQVLKRTVAAYPAAADLAFLALEPRMQATVAMHVPLIA